MTDQTMDWVQEERDDIGSGEQWMAWLSGPLTIGVFLGAPFMIAALLVDADRAYADALATVADAVRPATDDYWSAATLVATLMVALAAATSLGRGSRDLDARARTIVFAAVVVGSLPLIVLAALSIFVAIVTAAGWAHAMLVLAATWAVLLVSQLVFGRGTVAQRRREAVARWEAAVARAGARSEPVGLRREDWVGGARRCLFGVLPSSALAVVMMTTGVLLALGVALAVFTAAAGCVFLVRPLAARVPLLMRIERAATLRSLTRIRARVEELAPVADEASPREATIAADAAAR